MVERHVQREQKRANRDNPNTTYFKFQNKLIKYKSVNQPSIHLPLCSVKIFDPSVLESLLRGFVLVDLVVEDAVKVVRSFVC